MCRKYARCGPCVQVNCDGSFKTKHLAKCGVRSDSRMHDARLPLSTFLHDDDRDKYDASIVDVMGATTSQCKSCNDFKADPSDTRCEFRVSIRSQAAIC